MKKKCLLPMKFRVKLHNLKKYIFYRYIYTTTIQNIYYVVILNFISKVRKYGATKFTKFKKRRSNILINVT